MDKEEDKIRMKLLEHLMSEMGQADMDKFAQGDDGMPKEVKVTEVGIAPNEGEDMDDNGIPSQESANKLVRGSDMMDEEDAGKMDDDNDWGSPRMNRKMTRK